MVEYIEREALGIDKCNPEVFENKGYANGWNAAIDIIQNAPAADVVHVVRCGECEYRKDARVNKKGFLICPASGMEITDHDYCSYGARMDGDGDA